MNRTERIHTLEEALFHLTEAADLLGAAMDDPYFRSTGLPQLQGTEHGWMSNNLLVDQVRARLDTELEAEGDGEHLLNPDTDRCACGGTWVCWEDRPGSPYGCEVAGPDQALYDAHGKPLPECAYCLSPCPGHATGCPAAAEAVTA